MNLVSLPTPEKFYPTVKKLAALITPGADGSSDEIPLSYIESMYSFNASNLGGVFSLVDSVLTHVTECVYLDGMSTDFFLPEVLAAVGKALREDKPFYMPGNNSATALFESWLREYNNDSGAKHIRSIIQNYESDKASLVAAMTTNSINHWERLKDRNLLQNLYPNFTKGSNPWMIDHAMAWVVRSLYEAITMFCTTDDISVERETERIIEMHLSYFAKISALKN